MNKIAKYLNEHILGEVTSTDSVRQRFSRDGSILSIMPEMVVHPRVTNDIRKVARFTWQLAEKGHIMPITVRGGGSDQTGAAIGKGIIVNTIAHLNKIIYINPNARDRFVHVQPGVNFGNLNDTLQTHGIIVPSAPIFSQYSTVGGEVANNSRGPLSGRYGSVGDWVTRLEVVLANGDLIESTRISKRELDKKKGLQTFEGELYRKIDGIIDDNQKLITDEIIKSAGNNAGYPGIARVKNRDGSFDLTPLLIGSQGTLGIISEIVLKSELYNSETTTIVIAFSDTKIARDTATALIDLKPTELQIIDGTLFETAQTLGKKYPFTDKNANSVMIISFNESGHALKRKVKQTMKKLSKLDVTIYSSDNYSVPEIDGIRAVTSVTLQPDIKGESCPPLISGAAIPVAGREEFIIAVNELSAKHHVDLPISINWIGGIVNINPILNLHNTGDKQKTLKLISDYADIVTRFGGNLCASSGEGRLKSTAAYAQLNNSVVEIYTQIRAAFDPFGTLNPDVKQSNDLKKLIPALNSDYSLADFAEYSPQI